MREALQQQRTIREKYEKNAGKIREKYESSSKNETGGPRPLVFPRALVFFSYFSRIFLVFWLLARTGKNTRKNTRALGKTRRAALSYFSRIFPVFFSYFCCGPSPQQKYGSSRKNETGGPRPLVFPRALVFFSYFSRIFLVFWLLARTGKNTRKIREL